MSGETADPTSKSPSSGGGSDVGSERGWLDRWLTQLGIRPPPACREALRLYQRSRETFALAQQVAAASRCPEDGAQLTSKALQLLMLAVLSMDGVDRPQSHAECVAQIRASRAHRKLFADLLDELSFLEELPGSMAVTLDDQAVLGERYERLTKALPRLYRAVQQHLLERARQAGARPALRRLLVGAVLVAVLGLAFLLVATGRDGRSTPAAEPYSWADRGAADTPQEVLDDSRMCLEGTYYGDASFQRPVLTRRDCRIEFNWGEEAPHGDAAIPRDGFSVRWQGLIRVPVTDEYTFYLASDDGSRLYVDGELVIDNWGPHGLAEQSSRTMKLRRGVAHPIRIDYVEIEGLAQVRFAWSSTTIRKETVPALVLWRGLVAPDAGARVSEADPLLADPTRCFRASYFRGKAFETLVHARRDCTIDFDWGTSSVEGIEELPPDGFSVRWEGILRVPETAPYRFYLGSDDGSRLYLEGELVMGEWFPHGLGEIASEPMELEQGVDYPIRVEFFEEADLAQIELHWSSPSLDKQPLSGQYVFVPGREREAGVSSPP